MERTVRVSSVTVSIPPSRRLMEKRSSMSVSQFSILLRTQFTREKLAHRLARRFALVKDRVHLVDDRAPEFQAAGAFVSAHRVRHAFGNHRHRLRDLRRGL